MYVVTQMLADQRMAELRQEAERERRLRALRSAQPGRGLRLPGRRWSGARQRPRSQVLYGRADSVYCHRAAGQGAGGVR